MRIVLVTGKGGVGKTTTASATALRLADRGLRTLLVSTDTAHSLSDALDRPLDDRPGEVSAQLWAAQLDTQGRFEAAWREIQGFLTDVLTRGGTDGLTAEELTVLPGVDEVLALLAVHEFATSGEWDAVVVDCAPTAETLRLLALPEALTWYLQRVLPTQRRLAAGLRPFVALLGRGDVLPPDGIFAALLRLADNLGAVHQVLADPAVTSVRLVLTPESVVVAETRRTFTALALYGYAVDEVVANRVFPPGGDAWRRGWAAAQREQLAVARDSFAGLPVRELAYRASEPVGLDALRTVADDLYGALPGADPAALRPPEPLLRVEPAGDQFVLSLALPLAERSDVDATRVGDDLVVTVGGHRRVVTLPAALRRCQVAGGGVEGGRLRVRFRPTPDDDATGPARDPVRTAPEAAAAAGATGPGARARPSPRPRPEAS